MTNRCSIYKPSEEPNFKLNSISRTRCTRGNNGREQLESLLDREVNTKKIKRQTERERGEKKKTKRTDEDRRRDLYRTDYSTLNRVFGWNIGIRGRKPTQSDTQGGGGRRERRGTPAWAEGFRFSPRFCCSIFVFFCLSPSTSTSLMLTAHKETRTSLRYRLEKIVGNFPLYPFNLIYTRRWCRCSLFSPCPR